MSLFFPYLFSINAILCMHFQKRFSLFLTLMIKKWQCDTWASSSWSKRAKYILLVSAYFKSPFSLSVELSVVIRVENNFESSSLGRKKGALVPQYGKKDQQSEELVSGNVSFYPAPATFYKMRKHVL